MLSSSLKKKKELQLGKKGSNKSRGYYEVEGKRKG